VTVALSFEHSVDRVTRMFARVARPARDALIVVGLLRAAHYFFIQDIQPWTFIGLDTRAYYRVDLAHPYAHSGVGGISSFLYSPAFAQALAPFGVLPFEAFYVVWAAVSVAILWWLVRPWPWIVPILSLPIIYELFVGNVNYLLAAAIVVSFRVPSLWAFAVLTKVSIGMGSLWFAVRREWRAFAIAVGTTLAIVAVSFVLSPSAWLDWCAFLTASSGENDLLWPRFAVSLGLVAVAGLTDRPWLVPVAVWFAQPNIIINSWVILLASVRLYHRPPRPRGQATAR
jgi:hypothetical protein